MWIFYYFQPVVTYTFPRNEFLLCNMWKICSFIFKKELMFYLFQTIQTVTSELRRLHFPYDFQKIGAFIFHMTSKKLQIFITRMVVQTISLATIYKIEEVAILSSPSQQKRQFFSSKVYCREQLFCWTAPLYAPHTQANKNLLSKYGKDS